MRTTTVASIIIPAYQSSGVISHCLQGLRQQSYAEFELIVVNSSPDMETARLVQQAFPKACYVQSERRLLPCAARNRGAAFARGEILVFTDPDCRPHPDWLTRLVAAHAQGHPVVGGGIDTVGRYKEQAIHMAKFGWWLPGGDARPCFDLATANSSYARRLWQEYGPFVEHRYCADSDLNWRLRQAGYPLWFEPRAVVWHHHDAGWKRALNERWQRGHDYGLARAAQRNWRFRCGLAALGFPLVPWLITGRSLRNAVQAGRLRQWMLTLPFHFMCQWAWALGELHAHMQVFSGNAPEHFIKCKGNG